MASQTQSGTAGAQKTASAGSSAALTSARSTGDAAGTAGAARAPSQTSAAITPNDRLYQVISTYFANVFATNLRGLAQTEAAKPDSVGDIRAVYQDVMNKYISLLQTGTADSQVYSKVLVDISVRYNGWCRANLTYAEFTELLYAALLPPPNGATEAAQSASAARVIIRSLVQFRAWIITESGVDIGMSAVAWFEQTRTLAEMWRDELYGILRREVDQINAYITAQRNGVTIRPGNAALVSRRVVENLQSSIRELLAEKAELIEQLNQYSAQYRQMRGIADAAILERDELQSQLNEAMRVKTGYKGASRAPWSAPQAYAMQPGAVQSATPPGAAPQNGSASAAHQQPWSARESSVPGADLHMVEDDFADIDIAEPDALN